MDTRARTIDIQYVAVDNGVPRRQGGEIVDEALVCFSVNGQELATFMCTPADLEWAALGFLYNESIIQSLEQVHHIRVSKNATCVDIWLRDSEFVPPSRAIVTSGCGGGVTFDDLSERHAPLTSSLSATPEQLAGLMKKMLLGAEAYKRARGIHTAALSDGEQILLQVEDVGRHNCLDKLSGAALQQGIATEDKILLSSGRISSEMINKARRLQTPLVCSRTSPTSLSVALATAWNMTIVAYLRQQRMRVYSHPQRVLDASFATLVSDKGDGHE